MRSVLHTGLDRLPTLPALVDRLRSSRVGVLAHPASVDRTLCHAAAVLSGLGIRPKIYFGPEHGFGGEAQDMIGVTDAHARDGAPIRSLYGDTFDKLMPRDEDLDALDCLVIDLQDIGSRYYTFVWTAVLCMRACKRRGVHVVVLDRPNPLSGDRGAMEGASQQDGYLSFVGLHPIAVRHSLTLGEIVAHQAEQAGLGRDDLTIVTHRGLPREAHAEAWGRPFVLPSPNMPTYDTALVYPGGCLLEGTNLSEGRGTTRPFELLGAPWVDGPTWAARAAEWKLSGVVLRPTTFIPTFHKHAAKVCGGLQVHVTSREAFRPYRTYLALIAAAHDLWPDAFRFRTERYEFVDDIPAFDLLTGSARARTSIEAGRPLQDWLDLVCEPDPSAWDAAREALSTYET